MALAALALQKQDVQLSYGVNRFAGKDNQSQLAKAEEAYKTAKGLSVGFDQALADYECCRKFIVAHRGGENNRFEILTDKLGDSGHRPALVAVPVFIAVPLQLNESGVNLPGGQIV